MTDQVVTDSKGDARVFEGPQAVEIYRLAVLLSGMRMELRSGMRMSAKLPSAFTIAKRQYGLKGSKEKLVTQVEALLAAQKAKVPYVQGK